MRIQVNHETDEFYVVIPDDIMEDMELDAGDIVSWNILHTTKGEDILVLDC